MVLNAYDAKICVWKTIKISTNTCVNVSKKHPYVTSCLFFLFILYMCCPLFFWILIYSLPPVVSTWVILHFRDARWCKEERDEEREKEREQKERESGVKPASAKKAVFAGEEKVKGKERIKKAYSRVHSVRRRKAKELEIGYDPYAKRNADEEDDEDEDYNAYLSTYQDLVDKKAQVEESPKEIHEVEVAKDISINNEIYSNPELVRTLRLLKDEGDTRDEANKAMDVNIAEDETNKRLESLMARRRSKKDITKVTDIKKSLMTNVVIVPPLVIPKVNSWCSPGKTIAPFSPGPGSAPSMLGPTRNPFDLPYDPQEEKPDLTGDGFLQEFATGHNRDFTFCRHESFSLGPSLHMDFFEDRDDISSIDDFGFRRRRSSIGYHFPRAGAEESDTDFGATTEAESGHEGSGDESDSCPDSKSKFGRLDTDHSDNDQIKEVIQVHENGAQTPTAQGRPGDPNTRPNTLDDLSLSEASSGSSEDDRPPVCKINREAILKSLSMRRNSVSIPDIEMESNDQLQENNLSYANSALENASRLKQQYFADKPQKRHGMTFSIASDMQVEVSELSSPPLTIGENMSYQDDASTYDGEMDRNASWDGLDSWAGSSRMSEAEDNETRPLRAYEAGAASKHCATSSASTAQASADLRGKVTAQSASSPGSTSSESSSDEDTGEEPPAPPAAEDFVAAAKAEATSSAAEVAENVATNEGDTTSSAQGATISNNPPQEQALHPTISPKSVLQQTLSVASFEHEEQDEARLSRAPNPADRAHSTAPQNSRSSGVQFTVGMSSNGANEPSQHTPSKHIENKIQAYDDEKSSSTSLSSGEESSDIDYEKIKMKLKEESSSSRNMISYADKGKMVMQDSSHELDTETSSGDYDSEEMEERDNLHEGEAK